jgi:hypothetical protein
MWSSMKADKRGHVAWDEVNTRVMGSFGGPVGKGGMVGHGGSSTPK